MTTPHEIIVIIDTNGNIESEVKGVKGPECSKISAWLDKLGIVTEDRKTDDYFGKDEGQHVRTGY